MISLNANPIPVLKSILVSYGVTTTIYEGEAPTANIPAEFIEILHNGSLESDASQFGRAQSALIIAVYVKLLSNGTENTQRVNSIIAGFQNKLLSGTTTQSGFSFSLDKNKMVIYQGRAVLSGYSTKLINIKLTSI